jgi:hypothetical protein
MDMKRLIHGRGKILRRLYGLVVEKLIWRIRTNKEMRELYTDLDIVADILRRGWSGLDIGKNGSGRGS